MTVVSISKAAKLTGKARSTIQAYIKTGKLSKTTNNSGEKGIDTSELIRVFGELKTTDEIQSNQSIFSHQTTSNTTDHSEINSLKIENKQLKTLLSEKEERLQDKQNHIDTLKQALILLEHHQNDQSEKPKRKKFLGIF